jgi:hypothetical protein
MNYFRAHEIRRLKKTSNILESFMRAHPNLDYRYLIKPEESLIYEINFVDFKPKRSERLIGIGKEVATEVIS